MVYFFTVIAIVKAKKSQSLPEAGCVTQITL